MQCGTLNIIEIPESLSEIYREIAVSPINLLQNYALNHIRSKIQKYEAENSYFIKKYSCNLKDFKNMVESMENEENFTLEDDLMDWEFAVENLIFWQRKEQLLTSL